MSYLSASTESTGEWVQLDYGRTKLASERAADQIHASGIDGAA